MKRDSFSDICVLEYIQKHQALKHEAGASCYFQGCSETSLENLACKPGCYSSRRRVINWREFREEKQNMMKGLEGLTRRD